MRCALSWAVSKVKAPGVKTKFTTLEQVEPGIYQVRVEILCVVTYEVAGRAMDKTVAVVPETS